jgi:hypothetical protein
MWSVGPARLGGVVLIAALVSRWDVWSVGPVGPSIMLKRARGTNVYVRYRKDRLFKRVVFSLI